MERKTPKIATVFFLVASLFAGGITVATWRCDPGPQVCFSAVLKTEARASSWCNVAGGMAQQNPVHKLGQCKCSGLCYGYFTSGKTIIPLLQIAAHTNEIPLIPATLSARGTEPGSLRRASPLYILNLSFLC